MGNGGNGENQREHPEVSLYTRTLSLPMGGQPSRLITCSRGYPDPTADAAIANVMREEKHKRKEELMAKLRKKQYEQEVVKELEKENRRECRKQMKQGKEAGDA